MNEPRSSMNKQRVLLPLEPDFSTMSDPSIIIQSPTNTLKSNRSASLKRPSRGDQPKSKHKKRRRYISSSSSSSSCLLPEEVESQRSLNILIRKEDADILLLLNLLKTMVGNKDGDNPLLGLSMFIHHNNLIGL